MKPIDLQQEVSKEYCKRLDTYRSSNQLTYSCGHECSKDNNPVSDPCYQDDWDRCPLNKPKPEETEWQWYLLIDGVRSTTCKWYTTEEMEHLLKRNNYRFGCSTVAGSDRLKSE